MVLDVQRARSPMRPLSAQMAWRHWLVDGQQLPMQPSGQLVASQSLPLSRVLSGGEGGGGLGGGGSGGDGGCGGGGKGGRGEGSGGGGGGAGLGGGGGLACPGC